MKVWRGHLASLNSCRLFGGGTFTVTPYHIPDITMNERGKFTMRDVKKMVEIGKELAEKKKKQDIKARKLKIKIRENEVNPNPSRVSDIKLDNREALAK